MRQFIEEARRLIRIHSVSTDGNEEIANYVCGLMVARSMKAQTQQVFHSVDGVSKRQFNVIGILGDPLVDKKTRKGLLLSTHLDTVNPGITENWTETGGDPFCAAIKGGQIFGLGAADAKLDFLCKLKAVEKFREKKLRAPLYLVGTCGEEIGMLGAKYLIKSLTLNPKYALIGEPTDLKVVYAHKSMSVFRITIGFKQVERDAKGYIRRVELHSFGRGAHGSCPAAGVNAIDQLVGLLRNATENGFELRYEKLGGGDAVNKVPDRAFAEFFLASNQFEDFKGFIRDAVSREGLDRAFHAEIGGLGDSGVKFLPGTVFPCLVEILQYFQSLAFEFNNVQDVSFNPPTSTVNFGKLGTRSDAVDLHFDVRLLPRFKMDEIQSQIVNGIKSIAQKYPEMNLSAVRERSNPSLDMTEDHPLVTICGEAMEEAGIQPFIDKKAASTEAALYFHAGYEAIVFGPGKFVGNSHSPNENNMVEHLEKAVLFYEKVIEKVCL